MAKAQKDVIVFTPNFDDAMASLVSQKLIDSEYVYSAYEQILCAIARVYPIQFSFHTGVMLVTIPFSLNGQAVSISFSFFKESEKSKNISISFCQYDSGKAHEYENLPNWHSDGHFQTQIIEHVYANKFAIEITKRMQEMPGFDMDAVILDYINHCITNINKAYQRVMADRLRVYNENRHPDAMIRRAEKDIKTAAWKQDMEKRMKEYETKRLNDIEKVFDEAGFKQKRVFDVIYAAEEIFSKDDCMREAKDFRKLFTAIKKLQA